MKVGTLIAELIDYARTRNLISEEDEVYCTSRLMEILSLTSFDGEKRGVKRELYEILSDICDYACEAGLIENNSVVCRDLFDTRIMGALTPPPSSVIRDFGENYKISPTLATDIYYALACNSNYIRTDRIKRDVKWKYLSEYGEIDITVNLSKPEKDPRAIEAERLISDTGFPRCSLCHENEGFAGTVTKPARQNLRQIPLNIGSERWYLQYSPYVYYNEHCILLSAEHRPMKIDRSTIAVLLEFVARFPHYFIGSNADLKIVGGSILSHNHMQGGRYVFAMEKAKIEIPLAFDSYPDVTGGILKWPMSVIRITSACAESLISLADRIISEWRGYTDEDSFIFRETDGQPHNTITPIARRRGEKYELDLVLRNNIVTESHPLGLYHPHKDKHNIKKENIGLIEVMGLAVLPARLKEEMEIVKKKILLHESVSDDERVEKHAEWLSSFQDKYVFTEENTDRILKMEIGKTFVNALHDAGVYNDTEQGKKSFLKFLQTAGIVNK